MLDKALVGGTKMARFTYLRDAVPVGEVIRLEAQFADSAGNPKDTTTTPTISIMDANGAIAVVATSQLVIRIGLGRYRYQLTVPDGYTSGTWNDTWVGVVDGYQLQAIFDFHVDSRGSISAVGTTPEPDMEIGDEVKHVYHQEEIRGINILLKTLSSKLRNIAFKADGSRCDVFEQDDLVEFLCSGLSEFNSTPTITGFSFADQAVYTTFKDVITTGAMLQAWYGQAILESGKEWTITDNGVTITPPGVSSAITNIYNSQLSDYRAKLKEIKRNLRPSPRGMGAGSILVNNPALRRLRHRSENRII